MNTDRALPTERTYQILVATDLSELSNRALEQAIALSAHHPYVKLHVLTVGAPKDEGVLLPGNDEPTQHAAANVQAHVVEQVARYERGYGLVSPVEVTVYVGVGRPADRILALARYIDADLIVMGTHGRHGISRLFEGSVAEEVVREAACAVHVVHEQTRRPAPRSEPPPEVDVSVDGSPEVELRCEG